MKEFPCQKFEFLRKPSKILGLNREFFARLRKFLSVFVGFVEKKQERCFLLLLGLGF